MCYSAQIWTAYERYVREFGATLSIQDFTDLYGHRVRDPKIDIPRGLDLAVLADERPELEPARELIRAHDAQARESHERTIFEQRKRVADAERKLQVKSTKTALEDVRIGTKTVEQRQRWLKDLARTKPEPSDARIFPKWYAPVLVVVDGQRLVLPMRYQCRPAGKPAFYDTKFSGTYNARRTSLRGFWKEQFGHTHGLIVVERFYENVERDGRKVRLEFVPSDGQNMMVACLWSRWVGPDGETLLSFAAVTDEPPPEVAAAGHDRCIVQLRPENVDAWLNPQDHSLDELDALLGDRVEPYYEHRLAA